MDTGSYPTRYEQSFVILTERPKINLKFLSAPIACGQELQRVRKLSCDQLMEANY